MPSKFNKVYSLGVGRLDIEVRCQDSMSFGMNVSSHYRSNFEPGWPGGFGQWEATGVDPLVTDKRGWKLNEQTIGVI
jgi:hypothetical protein